MIEELIALGEQIHTNNVAKGFWPEDVNTRNKGEAVMLMITELSEAVEIHRKYAFQDKRYGPDFWAKTLPLLNNIVENRIFVINYEALVKNTVEEELADVTIRLLDYCYGFDIVLTPVLMDKKSTGNFAEDALRVCYWIIEGFHAETSMLETDITSQSWSFTLGFFVKFCEWYKIDLLQHVQWKMRYNEQRAYKHGKSY
jgi:NTP pyrophosphatase (non-canonical NTP hydrolase)